LRLPCCPDQACTGYSTTKLQVGQGQGVICIANAREMHSTGSIGSTGLEFSGMIESLITHASNPEGAVTCIKVQAKDFESTLMLGAPRLQRRPYSFAYSNLGAVG
jgi:hypothetical protein